MRVVESERVLTEDNVKKRAVEKIRNRARCRTTSVPQMGVLKIEAKTISFFLLTQICL